VSRSRRRRPAWLGPEPTPGQPVRRARPYIWVTWLSPYLAGEAWCLWALWFRAHFKWAKDEDDNFDTAKYSAAHRPLVQSGFAALMEDGWQVWIEKQNKFKVAGDLADLTGDPDLVAIRGEEGKIEDAKSGKQRHADWWQVMIYMLAVPLDKHSPLRGLKKVTGRVRYQDRTIDVPAVSANERKQIVELIKMAASANEPRRTPSRHECRFCAITSEDCPDRIEDEEGDDASRDTNLF
jgi:hypothetical protein